jgi:outer membrane protein TolC
MNRQYRKLLSLVLSAVVLVTGCQPMQPFFFREDGDLSHYLDVATDIDYPDVEEPRLDEVNCARPPLTLKNIDDYETWDLSLQEIMRITLCNSQVMRQLGVRVLLNPLETTSPETLSRTIVNTVQPSTTYDPAIVESGYGAPTGITLGEAGGTGVEAALAAFDAQLDSSVMWNKNHRPQNRTENTLFPPDFHQDLGTFTSGITKTAADGTTFGFRNNTSYEGNNVPTPPTAGAFQALPSAWSTNFEATFSRPILQGGGTQFNRIAGPTSFAEYANGISPVDGVVIARIHTDLALTDFEGSVRDLTHDVEESYWDLYFAYRNLAAQKMGRDSALATWTKTAALFRTGSRGGSADREAQARAQYFVFRGQVEQAMSSLLTAESHLRYVMGLSVSDGRLIRPSDEPTTARVAFDWGALHCEALTRRVEIRKEKWQIKKRELELVAARNYLLPRLDATGAYRWLGLGDDLIATSNGTAFNQAGSNAFGVLTSGDFQEWQLGLQLSMPLGFRQQLSMVRNHELLLARERALLQDLELEISHQLGDAVRNVDLYYSLTQTNFNRRVAAEKEVQAVQAAYDANRATMDLLLQAQARRAEAESAYYQSLVNYNRAIMGVHYRKGSLLDYNGVFLAEGPWPGKAYFDALRQARKRDASMYLDYGFTRPNVFSRGPYQQQGCQEGCSTGGTMEEMIPGEGFVPDTTEPEAIEPQEILPAPSSAAPMLVPPDAFSNAAPAPMTELNAADDAARGSNEQHQAHYPVAQAAADSPVGWWSER